MLVIGYWMLDTIQLHLCVFIENPGSSICHQYQESSIRLNFAGFLEDYTPI